MSSAGIAGRMYPGSLEWEREKNAMGTSAQRKRKTSKVSAGWFGALLVSTAALRD
jgi:hypothetical protein